MSRAVLVIVFLLLLNGCGGGGTTESKKTQKSSPSETITETFNSFQEDLYLDNREYYYKNLSNYKEVNISIRLDTLDNLYLIFTKNETNSSISIQDSINKSNKKNRVLKNLNQKESIAEFNRVIPKEEDSIKRDLKITEYHNDKVDDEKYFYLDKYGNSKTLAVLKKVIKDVETDFGKKNLEIWVSKDSYINCEKKYCVDDEDINSLAETFLKDGNDNDIYDWVTNIFGEEWGEFAQKYNSLVNDNSTITILLTDINSDNRAKNTIYGFFWAKDNFLKNKYAGSNERLMIYLDSVVFANRSLGDFYKKEIYSTLAHEFQHMIHFYQRNIKHKVSSEVWLNEMLSEATEDLIATKIKHYGPRGVPYFMGSAGDKNNSLGRYSIYNLYNYDSLTNWDNSMKDYAHVSAFAAYILRNYNALKIFNYIVTTSHYSGKKALEEAIKVIENKDLSMKELLNKFAVAVILSDKIDLDNDVDRFNFGDFKIVEYNNIDYYLGSINFYNYKYKPNFFNDIKNINENSNIFYNVTLDNNKSANFYFKIPEGFSVSLVAK